MASETENDRNDLAWLAVLLGSLLGVVMFLWKRPTPDAPEPPGPIAAPPSGGVNWKPISQIYFPTCGKTLQEIAGTQGPLLKRMHGDQYEMEWPNPKGKEPIRFHYDQRQGLLQPLNNTTRDLMSGRKPCS